MPMPQPAGEVVLDILPARLHQVSRMLVLTGTITGQTADGALSLRTQAGELLLRAQTPLPADHPVILQIPPGSPPTRALAFTLPQHTAPAPPPIPPAGAAPSTPPPADIVAAPAPPPSPGTMVTATVIAAHPATTAPRPEGSPLPPAPSPPPSGSQPSGSPPPQAAPQPAPAPAFRPAMVLELRVLEVPPTTGRHTPEASPPPARAPATTGIPATVTGTGSGGQAVLATPVGMLTVQTRSLLPVGTQLMLPVPPSMPAEAPVGLGSADPLFDRGWPKLRETLDAVARADPEAARTLARRILPQATPHLAAAMGHFVKQVRDGNFRRWIGEQGTAALEATGRKDLADGLEKDFETLARRAADPLPGDWKAFPLPFSDGAEISRIHLFVRSPPEDEENGADRKAGGPRPHRFVIDLELSRLGELQIDGLMQGKRFDLILRTRDPLPAEIRGDIDRIFTATIAALGMTGGTAFQPNGQGWVAITPRPATDRGVLV